MKNYRKTLKLISASSIITLPIIAGVSLLAAKRNLSTKAEALSLNAYHLEFTIPEKYRFFAHFQKNEDFLKSPVIYRLVFDSETEPLSLEDFLVTIEKFEKSENAITLYYRLSHQALNSELKSFQIQNFKMAAPSSLDQEGQASSHSQNPNTEIASSETNTSSKEIKPSENPSTETNLINGNSSQNNSTNSQNENQQSNSNLKENSEKVNELEQQTNTNKKPINANTNSNNQNNENQNKGNSTNEASENENLNNSSGNETSLNETENQENTNELINNEPQIELTITKEILDKYNLEFQIAKENKIVQNFDNKEKWINNKDFSVTLKTTDTESSNNLRLQDLSYEITKITIKDHQSENIINLAAANEIDDNELINESELKENNDNELINESEVNQNTETELTNESETNQNTDADPTNEANEAAHPISETVSDSASLEPELNNAESISALENHSPKVLKDIEITYQLKKGDITSETKTFIIKSFEDRKEEFELLNKYRASFKLESSLNTILKVIDDYDTLEELQDHDYVLITYQLKTIKKENAEIETEAKTDPESETAEKNSKSEALSEASSEEVAPEGVTPNTENVEVSPEAETESDKTLSSVAETQNAEEIVAEVANPLVENSAEAPLETADLKTEDNQEATKVNEREEGDSKNNQLEESLNSDSEAASAQDLQSRSSRSLEENDDEEEKTDSSDQRDNDSAKGDTNSQESEAEKTEAAESSKEESAAAEQSVEEDAVLSSESTDSQNTNVLDPSVVVSEDQATTSNDEKVNEDSKETEDTQRSKEDQNSEVVDENASETENKTDSSDKDENEAKSEGSTETESVETSPAVSEVKTELTAEEIKKIKITFLSVEVKVDGNKNSLKVKYQFSLNHLKSEIQEGEIDGFATVDEALEAQLNSARAVFKVNDQALLTNHDTVEKLKESSLVTKSLDPTLVNEKTKNATIEITKVKASENNSADSEKLSLEVSYLLKLPKSSETSEAKEFVSQEKTVTVKGFQNDATLKKQKLANSSISWEIPAAERIFDKAKTLELWNKNIKDNSKVTISKTSEIDLEDIKFEVTKIETERSLGKIKVTYKLTSSNPLIENKEEKRLEVIKTTTIDKWVDPSLGDDVVKEFKKLKGHYYQVPNKFKNDLINLLFLSWDGGNGQNNPGTTDRYKKALKIIFDNAKNKKADGDLILNTLESAYNRLWYKGVRGSNNNSHGKPLYSEPISARFKYRALDDQGNYVERYKDVNASRGGEVVNIWVTFY